MSDRRRPGKAQALPGARMRVRGRPAWRAALCAVVVVAAVALAGLPARALDPDKAFHHYVQDVWSIEHGLPQITVLAIAQDPTGYIWVGTQAGLARFDGVEFTRYDVRNTPELPGLFIHDLSVDARGRLWIGTYKGLAVLDEGRIVAVPPVDADAFPILEVNDVLHRADGRVLVATTQGLFAQTPDGLASDPRLREPTLSLLEHEGALWVGGRGVVYRIAGDRIEPLALPQGYESAAVTALLHAQGETWAATNAGLVHLQDGRWVRYEAHPALAGSPVHTLFLDRDENLWIGTQQGLARLRQGVPTEFVADENPAAHRAIRAIAQDHEGNLWLGSQWEGLARMWSGWTRRYSVAEGLHEQIVWSVAPGPGQSVYVGTNDGLSVLREGRFELLARGSELPHPHAYTLLVDPGRVWIGTRAGLAVLEGGAIVRPPQLQGLGGAQINGIVRDSADRLWFATTEGLFRWHQDRLDRFGTEHGLADARVRLVRETADGQLLVGTQVGLYRFADGRLEPLGGKGVLPSDIDVTAIHELQDGTLVLGTLSEQLFVSEDGRWSELTSEDGLPVNSPFFITDREGWLWVAGIRGIYRVPLAQLQDFAAGRIHRVDGEMLLNERGDRRSGQRGYCCNGAGNAKGFLRAGELWLPTRDGVVAMPTDGIEKNPHAPAVAIERVRVGEQWRPAAGIQGGTLPPDARDLAFNFTALSFQDPQSVQLRYRLSGYDTDWRLLEDPTRRQAVYTNLPPGGYTFEVTASNNADQWSPEPARTEFSIQPYFHETGWFFVLIALALVAMAWAAYRYKVRSLTSHRRELEALVARRTDDLAAANRRLEAMSQSDPLTGLKNRRFVLNQIPADLAFYEREAARPGQNDQVLVFAMVDVDHFKSVNDSHGHKAGDRVLQQFARVLLQQVRTGDYVVRWGGEEFLLVFRPMQARKSVLIAERIRQAVAAFPFDIGHAAPLRLTASIGFVEYPLFRDDQHALGWEPMVELADHALYYVKSHGRNGWAAFRPTLSTDITTVIEDLRDDIEGLVAAGRLEVMSSRKAPA
ncbi:MAG TPA: diguanylate cyclase [Xanthomonadaceae bacterium]|nr:diguanylate cyclase [Xanthomonadaceae bacterium]